jgi:hypothetical protein
MLDVRTEVLDQHVGLLDHLQQNRASLVALEVEGDAALVRVDVLEVEAVAVAGAVFLGLRRFDLDDLGAVLGELADAGWSRPSAAEIDDFDV